MFTNNQFLIISGVIIGVFLIILIWYKTRKKPCLSCEDTQKRFCVNCLTHTCIEIDEQNSSKTICSCCKE
jgi:hypothetical protein